MTFRTGSFRLLAVFLIFALLLPLSACGAPVLHTSRVYAMGTLCLLTEELPHGEDGDSSPLFSSLLADAEALLSHKKDGSFADLINALDYAVVGGSDRMLLERLRLAEEIKEKTGGLFSVSVLPITSLWDFESEDPAPPTEEAIFAALAEMEGSALHFENETVTKTGGGIDLGAMGKGYACDVLADALRMKNKNALVSVGGSIAAIGSKANGAWQVGVRDPFSDSQSTVLGTLALTDTFVSTSGSYEKCFTYEGETYHHILDPHTGMPAESDLVSVTVVAGKGTLSDILSTACFLVGSEAAFSLAAEYEAALIAVKADGTLLVSESLRELFAPKGGWEPIYR
ncbi:MAG: FAD:protein FMN transferase [Ruminococcaceae bacterium]|nr:FAD:protein FMN transferase [Oscillospiraceae bacterium]